MSKALENWIKRYAEFTIRWRWLILVANLAICAVLLAGASKLTFSADYKVYFGPTNPQLNAFDEVQNVYSKIDNTFMIVQPPGDDAFNADTMRMVQEMTERAWQVPHAIRVDSISNYQHTEADGDDLRVGDLVPAFENMTPQEFARLRDIAIDEPLLRGRLVSPTGHVVALSINHQFTDDAVTEVPEAVAAERAIRDEMLAKYPGHKIYMSGSNMMSNAFAEASQADATTLYPAMYTILLIILFVLLRSVTGTLVTLTVILLSAGGAMGLAGHLGFVLTSPSVIAPVIVTTLAVADAVHILVTMFAEMREGKDKRAAVIESLRLNFVPVMLTSVTTALGLLSVNFADSPPLADLGNISAMGAMLAWLLSISLLPAMIAILPLKAPAQKSSLISTRMEAFGRWTTRHPRGLLIGSVIVAVGLTSLAPLNVANDKFVHFFDTSIDFRNDSDFMADNITGLYTMEYSLKAPDGIADPGYLAKLDAFSKWWMTHEETIQVSSVSDIFKRLNKNMHGDDPAWYKLPDDRELAAQYLLLYEFSLPFGLDLTNTISIDKDASRYVVSFKHLKSAETRALVDEGQQWLDAHAPEMQGHAVSPGVMFAYIAQRNFQSMAIGIPLALLGISIILIVALGSLKFGLISLLPNLLPMGMAFGLWAIYNGEINFAMSFSMGVVLGIIVDDTIHFLSKYLRARNELGLSTEEAIVYSFRTVGTALVVTSIVLAAGFLVLTTSAFYPTETMSSVTVMAIFCALVADFCLLPAVLMLFDRDPVVQSDTPNSSKEPLNETAYA